MTVDAEKRRAYKAEWRRQHPEAGKRYYQENKEAFKARARRSRWMREYGLTEADYARMLADQNGVCAICGGTDPGDGRYGFFSVDHDHATGKIRGLLCSICNTTLGKFKDDASRFDRAAAYLRSRTC
jgi:hypothetical protein